MAEKTFTREHVVALEKILGVKLPEQGFTLEIKPLAPTELDPAQLDGVVGGTGAQAQALHFTNQSQGGVVQIPTSRWTAKI